MSWATDPATDTGTSSAAIRRSAELSKLAGPATRLTRVRYNAICSGRSDLPSSATIEKIAATQGMTWASFRAAAFGLDYRPPPRPDDWDLESATAALASAIDEIGHDMLLTWDRYRELCVGRPDMPSLRALSLLLRREGLSFVELRALATSP